MGSPQEIDKTLKARNVTVKTVDGSIIQGKVNIGAENRISDLFTASTTPFVVVFDAMYSGGSDKVLILNKTNIVWIEPEDV